ncbi:nucleotidyltransferase family protein [Tistrella bauzanensis]|uniref:nucleotidyltransferase family protein n=1 Tax=Tistrella bauzanensis TaxID=657419 RepID=UPI0035587D43
MPVDPARADAGRVWTLARRATAPHPAPCPAPDAGGAPLDDASSHLMVALAERHRLPGLLAAGLSGMDVRLSAAAAAALRSLALRDAMITTRLAARMFSLLDAFAAEGISARVMKGLPVAALAYGRLGLRHVRDVDFLVPEDDFVAAHEVILAHGFTPMVDLGRVAVADLPRYAHELPYSDDQGSIVELHAARSAHRGGRDHAAAPLATVQVMGRAVPVDPFPDIFVHLCRHGASHAWCLLKWLADISHLIASPSARFDWEAVAETTRRSGSARHVGLALALAGAVHDVTPPPALAGFVGTVPSGLVHRIVAMLADPMSGGPTPMAMARLEVGLASGPGAKAAALRDFMLTPTLQDARDWPLPHGLLWAARPVLYAARRLRRASAGVT